MSNSEHLQIIVEANNSDWKEPCYQRLKDLLNMRFSPTINHRQHVYIKEIMKPELYNAVRDTTVDVDKFLDVLKNLCSQNQLDCKTILLQATPTGDSLLHVAAEYGREEIAELLVDHALLLDATNIKKDTPLHVAARAKNIGVMKVILSKFEDASKDEFIMSQNILGNTALHEAILSKSHKGFYFLLREQSGSSLPGYWDTYPAKSPIYVAVQTRDEKILCRLLQIPFPSDHVIYNCHQNSPLHAAILGRNTDLLKKIVDEKEELMYLRDEHGDTPLHFAAYFDYVGGVRELLKKSTLVAFQRNSNGNLPIHVACGWGRVQVVEEFLDVEWPYTKLLAYNDNGQNILHIATNCGRNKMVKYLLEHPKIHPKTVNEKDLNGDTTLHLASKKLHLWTLFHLSRDKNIKVNRVNNQGLTARDVFWIQSKAPWTREEYFANAILRAAGAGFIAGYLLQVRHVNNKEWKLNDAANTLILVAILIATVTFAAGFTIPGGFYSSDDQLRKERGMAVLANQTLFKVFMVFNTVAMHSSTLGSMILLFMHMGDRRLAGRAYDFAKHFVILALTTMPLAFMAAIRLIVSNNTLLASLVSVTEWSFIGFILFVGILGFFPFGTRLPFLRQVGKSLIWISLYLLRGREDIISSYEIEEILRNDQHRKANQVIAT